MDIAIRVQILGDVVCILNHANTLEKGMNPTNLPPAMGKIVEQTRLFSLSIATGLGEGKHWIQTC